MSVITLLYQFARDVRGATTIELGLICAMIVLAMMGALQGVAGESIEMWTTISAKSAAAINGQP
ncbi:MAG: Flp family type IVb pilin [Novosphingobium sp.]